MNPILINIVQGDADYNLNFSLTDAAGAIVNLTGAVVTFNAQSASDAGVQVTGTMSIVSPTAGTCYYQVQSTDFSIPGTYNAQIVAVYSSVSEKITFTAITIVVAARLPV